MGRVTKDLTTGKVSFDTELDPKELAVIGRVTVLWGRLEHLIMLATLDLAPNGSDELLQRAVDDVFSLRLRAFHDCVVAISDEPSRAKFLSMHGKIANLQRRRHQLTHGFWDWDDAKPNSMIVKGTRPKREFEATWDVESLYRFGSQIGEVLFELEFQGGWDEFLEQRCEAGGMISRDGLRMLTDTLPEDHPLAGSIGMESDGTDR